jgi:hypothetical protein
VVAVGLTCDAAAIFARTVGELINPSAISERPKIGPTDGGEKVKSTGGSVVFSSFAAAAAVVLLFAVDALPEDMNKIYSFL